MPKPPVPKKRKAEDPAGTPPTKSSKTELNNSTGASSSADSVVINRAPVLELWGASVAAFLHPTLSWQSCLSIGGAISTLCAISKGRAIGTIDKSDSKDAKRKHNEDRDRPKDLEEIAVMHFNLPMRDGFALVTGKPKKSNESTLKHKFGDQYEAVHKTFESALASWKGEEEDLDGQAFGMYEEFRPAVPTGRKGWGRQAEMSLEKATKIIRKPD